MVLFSLSGWLKRGKRRSPVPRRSERSRQARLVPGLERLEDRTVPSGYSLTPIDDPNAGSGASQGTFAQGINAPGQIVGYYGMLTPSITGSF
jgi:hypothetical protein